MENATIDHVKVLIDSKNYSQAYAAALPLAEAGNPLAQYEVGKLLFDGSGIDKDLKMSLYWYTKAAEQDHINSQYNLAQMFLDALGTKQSFDKAYYWLRRAHDLGDEECGEQMQELSGKVLEENETLSIIVDGFNFEDMAGALLQAADEMSSDQEEHMLISLHKNWGEFLNEAAQVARKEGAHHVSLSMLADVIPPSLAYTLLADVYNYRRLHIF